MELARCLERLPQHSRYATECVLQQLDSVAEQISRLEDRMQEVFAPTAAIDLLKSLPGVGFLLAAVIYSEVGDGGRFASASHFASYAGTAPRVHASGGKIRLGHLRSDVNRYLKWAFLEAANVVVCCTIVGFLTATSVSSMNGCAAAGDTRQRWVPWRATWRRPAIGC